MKNLVQYSISATLIFCFLFTGLPSALACGPFITDPIFRFTKHGEFPTSKFASGKVGVVPGSYGRISLFVFYRYLNNLPFTKAEKAQVVAAVEQRIGNKRAGNNSTQARLIETKRRTFDQILAEWKTARAKILNSKIEIETRKSIDTNYYSYANCLGGAFDTATKTLERRIAKFGTTDALKEWIRGQDAVFSNCGDDGKTPEEVVEGSPNWLKKDRQYQIAASLFYASKNAEARTRFQEIAKDNTSVWNKVARFVVARTYIRQASFSDISASKNATEKEKRTQIKTNIAKRNDLLKKAESLLRDIFADKSMAEFHNSAQRLIGLIKYRSSPTDRQKELSSRLTEKKENFNIYNDLTDYIWLLDQPEMRAADIGTAIDLKEAKAAGKTYDYNYKLKLRDIPTKDRQKDLSDWLYTYQSQDGFDHAYQKWNQTKAKHWLVAAISKATGNSPNVAKLIEQAKRSKPKTHGYATLRFHQIRLLIQKGKRAEAKLQIREIFANDFGNYSISTQNDFYALRMALAENLDEFLKFAQRRAAAFIAGDDGSEIGEDLEYDPALKAWANRTMFDTDSVTFFNEKMPLSVLRRAALSRHLPRHLKEFLVSAVWTRAFILGNSRVEREFAPLVLRYNKELSRYFSRYSRSRRGSARKAYGLIAILRYPVLQPFVPFGYGRKDSKPQTIDSIRGNWWCVPNENSIKRYDHYDFNMPNVYPKFLTSAQTARAKQELKQIRDSGNSATFLTRKAIAFAKRYPRHRSTPQILHLAVRSTRHGCTDKATGAVSKEAHSILHKKYPRSIWTKRTPYWFK